MHASCCSPRDHTPFRILHPLYPARRLVSTGASTQQPQQQQQPPLPPPSSSPPQSLFASSDAARSAWVAFQDIDFSSPQSATAAATAAAGADSEAEASPAPVAAAAAAGSLQSPRAEEERQESEAAASSDSENAPLHGEMEVEEGAEVREGGAEAAGTQASARSSDSECASSSLSNVQVSVGGRSPEGISAQAGQQGEEEAETEAPGDGGELVDPDLAPLPAGGSGASVTGEEGADDRAAAVGGVNADSATAAPSAINEEGGRHETDAQGGSEAREGTMGNAPAQVQGSVFDPFGLQKPTALVNQESAVDASQPSDSTRIEEHGEPGGEGKEVPADSSVTGQQLGEHLDDTFNHNCDTDDDRSHVETPV